MEVKDMAEMKVAYLHSKSWAEVTREERFFCAELFSLIREDGKARAPFFKLLGIDESQYDSFDVGFEVCFYRDVLKAHDGKKVRGSGFSQKRTFDLALMSDTDLYLIEAKAHGGFSSNDLANIKKDNAGKDSIKELFESLKVKSPTVHTVALISSGYDPKQSTKDCFEKVVTWDEVAVAYKDNERAHGIFKRADAVYGN